MDIQSTKKEITKLIHGIEDPDLIQKIYALISGEKNDFWHTLTEYEKEEIKIGIKQLDEGKGVSYDEFRKRIL